MLEQKEYDPNIDYNNQS